MIFYEDPEKQKGSLKLRIFRNIMMVWAMFIAVFGVGVISLLILYPPVEAIYQSITGNGCGDSSPRNATIEVGEATVLRVISGRGDLSVIGRPGLTAVQVTGNACADSGERQQLDAIVLDTAHNGNEIIVTVRMPRSLESGRLDLEIFVPEEIGRVEIDDTDGPVFVSNVRELQAVVGFGGLKAFRIGGSVNVPSLDGSMLLSGVEGDVTVNVINGYGEVKVDGVGGSVVLGDNRSGPATITDVGGDVTIGSAGYGNLSVSRVGGDLLVEENIRGQIKIELIGGSVRLPAEDAEPGA